MGQWGLGRTAGLTVWGNSTAAPGRAHLEVRVVQVLIGQAALEVAQQLPRRVGDLEGGQRPLAAPQAGGALQDVAEEPQLARPVLVLAIAAVAVAVRARRGPRLRGGGATAVGVAEGLAVAQQPVQPQRRLQVARALAPALAFVLLQSVAVGRGQWHQVLRRESSEAVLLVLRPGAAQQQPQQPPRRASHARAAPGGLRSSRRPSGSSPPHPRPPGASAGS